MHLPCVSSGRRVRGVSVDNDGEANNDRNSAWEESGVPVQNRQGLAWGSVALRSSSISLSVRSPHEKRSMSLSKYFSVRDLVTTAAPC